MILPFVRSNRGGSRGWFKVPSKSLFIMVEYTNGTKGVFSKKILPKMKPPHNTIDMWRNIYVILDYSKRNGGSFSDIDSRLYSVPK